MSFRRESHIPRGGPDGGDGGRGGHVIIRAEENIGSLAALAGHHHWRAERGQHGQGQLKTGRSGDDTVISVPPGTLVKDADRGHLLRDLVDCDQQVIVAQGGKGGLGNKRFATSTNRAPREFEKGGVGEAREVMLELKLIADVGLIGKPNAGKSTLLSRLSKANPEIANYPFTTKYPNLGLVQVDLDNRFVMADIPGLIEGAHQGVGLGHEFLRHVERTRLLIHLVEPEPMDQTDPLENYLAIREELTLYNPELAVRPELVVVTKCELPSASDALSQLDDALETPVRQISAVTGTGLGKLIGATVVALAETDSP
jgi:GTP-binding protein